MEAINDSTKLIAQALEKLKVVQCVDIEQMKSLNDAILGLEVALDKLLNGK